MVIITIFPLLNVVDYSILISMYINIIKFLKRILVNLKLFKSSFDLNSYFISEMHMYSHNRVNLHYL